MFGYLGRLVSFLTIFEILLTNRGSSCNLIILVDVNEETKPKLKFVSSTKNIVIRYNISLLWIVRMFLRITCIFVDFWRLIFLQHTQISSLIIQFIHAVTKMTLETKYLLYL